MKNFLLIFFTVLITWFISTQLDINWPRFVLIQQGKETAAPVINEPDKQEPIIPKELPEEKSKAPDFSEIEYEIFSLINKNRFLEDKDSLIWDKSLNNKCREHSQYMAETGNFVHSPYDFVENIFMLRYIGTGYEDLPDIVVDTWMYSPKHKSNLMDGEVTHCSIGVAKSQTDIVYVTFMAN